MGYTQTDKFTVTASGADVRHAASANLPNVGGTAANVRFSVINGGTQPAYVVAPGSADTDSPREIPADGNLYEFGDYHSDTLPDLYLVDGASLEYVLLYDPLRRRGR